MKINQDILYLCLIILIGLTVPFFLGSWSREGFESSSASTNTASSTTPLPSSSTASTTTSSEPLSNYNRKNLSYNNNSLEAQLNTDMNMIQNREIYKLNQRLNNIDSSKNNYDNYNHFLEKNLATQNSEKQNADDITTAQYYGSTGTPVIPQTEKEILATAKLQRRYDREMRRKNRQERRNNQDQTIPVTPISSPLGNNVVNKNNNNINDNKKKSKLSTDYSSVLPQGVKRSNIPVGEEDMYILKSQVIPPVCPACPAFPSASMVSKQESCPPCPPCGRCPEPAFDCKKVPNYDAINNKDMPVPVLNDFSTFGM